MWIQFWAKNGFGALLVSLYLEQREIFEIRLNEYLRSFQTPSWLFSYFRCQTFQWFPRFRKPGWIQIKGSRAYRGHLTSKVWKQKRMLLKLSKINIPSVEVQSPDPVYGQNLIQPTDFHPSKIKLGFAVLKCRSTTLLGHTVRYQSSATLWDYRKEKIKIERGSILIQSFFWQDQSKVQVSLNLIQLINVHDYFMHCNNISMWQIDILSELPI